jgi:hypothetical protein
MTTVRKAEEKDKAIDNLQLSLCCSAKISMSLQRDKMIGYCEQCKREAAICDFNTRQMILIADHSGIDMESLTKESKPFVDQPKSTKPKCNCPKCAYLQIV